MDKIEENNIEEDTLTMPKEEVFAFWNLRRVLHSIPKEEYGNNPNIQQMLKTYLYVALKYQTLLNDINKGKIKFDNLVSL